MATTFMEPGGDADFAVTTTNGFWGNIFGTPTVATDFVHGNHQRSIKYGQSSDIEVDSKVNAASDSGTRISWYVYVVGYGSTSQSPIMSVQDSTASVGKFSLSLTSAGVLQLRASYGGGSQYGSNGPTIPLNTWTRISVAYTISSTTVNRFEVFVNGVPAISATNVTVSVTTSIAGWGNIASSTTLDMRTSDHYIDNSSSLTDTGDIWVTAKRPVSNGSTNGFTTQVGSGGSGYGSGHTPQVNERPLSTTNGWSRLTAGTNVTEEYNIEGKSVGDIDISSATIIDYVGWISAHSALSETASIIVSNALSNISLTTTDTIFTAVAGLSTYPAGTGTDIGVVTSTTITTVTLNECGVIVAFIPSAVTSNLALLGVG